MNVSQTQLSASGIDIVTFLAADGGPDAVVKQGLAKETNSRFRRPFVGKAFHLVVGNQVDLGVEASGVLGQKFGRKKSAIGGVVTSRR